MAVTDIRKTVLQTINEVAVKRGLQVVTSLDANSWSVQALFFLNDVVAEISDYGDWDELLVTANTSCISSAQDYSIEYPTAVSAAVIKNIKDVYFGSAGVPLFMINQDQMRLLSRAPRYGQPAQWTIYGTDSNGNPTIRVTPIPATNQGGIPGLLSIRAFQNPPLYKEGDENVIIPLNSRLVVQGLLAAAILDEEGGSPTDHYTRERQVFDKMMKDSYSRFHSQSGRYRRFVPGSRRFRRGPGAG